MRTVKQNETTTTARTCYHGSVALQSLTMNFKRMDLPALAVG